LSCRPRQKGGTLSDKVYQLVARLLLMVVGERAGIGWNGIGRGELL
jgi:hypothetical protein